MENKNNSTGNATDTSNANTAAGNHTDVPAHEQIECTIPGHVYVVPNFDNPEFKQSIHFIHKKPKEPGATELMLISDGTTNEALLKVLIARMYFLQNSFPCAENAEVITHLEQSLYLLHKRTTDRKARAVEGTNQA